MVGELDKGQIFPWNEITFSSTRAKPKLSWWIDTL